MKNNIKIAKLMLEQAIHQRDDEIPLKTYIDFMNTLPEIEREKILNNVEIKKLIEKINKYI